MNRKLSAATLVGLEELTTPLPPLSDESVSRITPGGEQLVVNLPLKSIAPNPHQPRRALAPETLQELATSIAEHGRVLQPIIVRPRSGANGDAEVAFELVAGERRWRASELVGLPTIRAVVDGVDDMTSAEMALAENMARDDLSPIEEAQGCAALRDGFGMAVAEIARRVGRDRSAISHLIRLLTLPDDVLGLIDTGSLAEGHGRVLLRLAEPRVQQEVADACAREEWSVRELERRVDAAEAEPSSKSPADATSRPAELDALTEALQQVWEGRATIVSQRRGRYEIRVRCEDFGALGATVERIRAGRI